MLAERRAAGVTASQVGRELDVRPDQLRTWARLQHEAAGAGAAVAGETLEQENRRLRREVSTLRQELLHGPGESAQDASAASHTELTAHDRLASMSRKGDCCDHAVAESFLATLEFELIMQHDWHSRDEARRSIFRDIETWYNRKRRHSTLGYVSPAAYEAQLQVAA